MFGRILPMCAINCIVYILTSFPLHVSETKKLYDLCGQLTLLQSAAQPKLRFPNSSITSFCQTDLAKQIVKD